MDQALRELATEAGLATEWNDNTGRLQQVAPDILRRALQALDLPCESERQIADSRQRLRREHDELPPLITAVTGEPILLPPAAAPGESPDFELQLEGGELRSGQLQRMPDGGLSLPPIDRPGYHRLQLGAAMVTLAVAPPRAYSVQDVAGERRVWGLTTQLYSLRRPGDGGSGDFTALAQFAVQAAARGAQALAISPIHALFAADLDRYGPYAPSTRLLLNPQYVDPASAMGDAPLQELIARSGLGDALLQAEQRSMIDWPGCARLRLELLRQLHGRFAAEAPQERQKAFATFLATADDAVRDHARFEALHAHFFGSDPALWHWRQWPEAFRHPANPEVEDFAAAHASEVEFHLFLQWLADEGLAGAQQAARDAGMHIGLISDLAVGTDTGGSHAWSRQSEMLIGLTVGAPPDALAATGQNWGLTAFSPRALRRHGFEPFLEMLRGVMRHTGGVRIDHVLGLGRLWLIPDGASATEGVYLQYPLEDFFRLIALESWRNRSIVVGEDLGTVPHGFRDKLADAGILGMRVLWFEREWGLFSDPSRWTPEAVAMITTHDMAPIAGLWRGRDIDWRAQLNLFGEHATEATQREERTQERTKLWAACVHAGVAQGPEPPADEPQAVVDAAVAFVARTPCRLALVPLEDLLGLAEAPNVPGTIDEHPNWCRRLPVEVGQLLDGEAAAARLETLRRSREGL